MESELDFDRRIEPNGARGGGEALCDRLELPHGVTGVESCRSASPGVDSYRGDSCGSFEFLPNRRRSQKRRPSNLQEDSIQEVSDGDDFISEDDDEKLFLPKRSGARLMESGPGKFTGEQEQLFRQIDDFAAEQTKLLAGTGESNNSRKSSHGSSGDRKSNGSSGGRKSGSDRSSSGRPSQSPRLRTNGQSQVCFCCFKDERNC